ncbi:MAG: hypothetical protein ABI409_10090, partial [Ramlibacter sp.]
LAEYAAAVADERAAWQQWKSPVLKEAERDEAYLRWKNAADRIKALALRLAALKFEEPPRG